MCLPIASFPGPHLVSCPDRRRSDGLGTRLAHTIFVFTFMQLRGLGMRPVSHLCFSCLPSDHAAPMIRFTKLPWSQVVPLGGRFRLLCEAHSTADEPLHYQWYFNGLPQDGETDSQLIRSVSRNLRHNNSMQLSIYSTAAFHFEPSRFPFIAQQLVTSMLIG